MAAGAVMAAGEVGRDFREVQPWLQGGRLGRGQREREREREVLLAEGWWQWRGCLLCSFKRREEARFSQKK